MSNPEIGKQHYVVTYNLLDPDGVVKGTHATFDSEINNVDVPPGWSLQVIEIPPELPQREVNYVVARSEEYPSVGDQLDVIWAMFRANPQLLTSAGRAMLERINSVKTTYAKNKTYELNISTGVGEEGGGEQLFTPKQE